MSTYDDAKVALDAWDAIYDGVPADMIERETDAVAQALRALLGTREDNAPETIAQSVIAERYGDYDTFVYAMQASGRGLPFPIILNMLKEAAARGLDAGEEW